MKIPALLLVLITPLAAQETRGTIFGHVTDPHASGVANASVRITNIETNTSTALSTNQTGYYEAGLLLSGAYQISVEARGFRKAVRGGIILQTGAQVEAPIKLELGQVSETITVTDAAPALETGILTAGGVLNNQSIMELPVLGNNPTLLAKMVPGVQTGGVNLYLGLHSTGGGSDYYASGNVGGNEWNIDGAPNNGGGRSVAYLPYADTVREFRVETVTFDAGQGRGTGASITAVSNTGTNVVHGALTEQHWQQRWNGTPFFVKQLFYRRINEALAQGDLAEAEKRRGEQKQPSGHSNNWGSSIGGPVVLPKIYNGKDKLFFFFAYNGYIDRKTEPPSRINRTVPTLANKQGDFSQLLKVSASQYQLYDPLSVRPDTRAGHVVRDPIPGNIIPRARMINPIQSTYEKFYPTPNNDPLNPALAPMTNYLAVATPFSWDYHSFSNRLDYNYSDAHRFFARWSWSTFHEDRDDWTYETFRGLHTDDLNRKTFTAAGAWTYALSSATLLNLTVGSNMYLDRNQWLVARQFKPSDVGLPKYMDDWAGDAHILPRVTIDGYQGLGPTGFPGFGKNRTMSAAFDLTHVHGKHSIHAGFDRRDHFKTGGGNGNTSGTFRFQNTYTRKYDDNNGATPGTLGHSYAAFLLGLPGATAMTVSTNAETYAAHSPLYGAYIQHNWRLTRDFSLNFGLRTEYEVGPTERYNRLIGHFDRSAELPITAAAQAAYAANPIPELAAQNFVVRGGTVFPGTGSYDRHAYKSALMWMPRVAASWQIGARTVIRGGYGLYYDNLNALRSAPRQDGFNRTTSTQVADPLAQTFLVGNPAKGISPLVDPFPLRSDGTRFNQSVQDLFGLMTLAGRNFNTFTDYDTDRARNHRWRASIQRQIMQGTVVEAAYNGSYSDRNYITRNLRPLPEQYWAGGLVYQAEVDNFLTAQVANPFYSENFPDLAKTNPALFQDLLGQATFRDKTIQRQRLLRAFPQMTGLTRQNTPLGKVSTHALELILRRQVKSGLNVTFGYTRLSARSADYFANEFDAEPTWRPSNAGRPHRVVATGVYQLPFGRGRALLRSGLLSRVFGGFQAAATYEYQPGPLINFANLFYYGNIEDIRLDNPVPDQWFNTANFEKSTARDPGTYHRRVFPTRIDGVRRQSTNQTNVNLSRTFKLTERFSLQFRADALNVQNRTQFDDPEELPTNTNFGRVTAQTEAVNRFFQFQARIRF